MPRHHLFFAPCPRGLEDVLVNELGALQAYAIQSAPGGVAFQGDLNVCYRVNLQSRVASRVLMQVGSCMYRNEQDIYHGAQEVAWEDWFTPAESIRVDLAATQSSLKSLEFATLRIKDAVCDRMRARQGERPNVDTRQPAVRVYAYLTENRCTFYLDTSGEPLFKRAWRQEKGEAPLRENLAAGLLALLGWTPELALYDPMCGSGTFLIEAACQAAGMPPGHRRRFGFEALKSFDSKQWQTVRQAAMRPPQPLLIAGSDISGDMLSITRDNLERAGIDPEQMPLKQVDARAIRRPFEGPGVLVANPPYGERMGFRGVAEDDEDAASAQFYAAFSATLKKEFADWRVGILTANRDVPKQLRLQPKRKFPLFNGNLECRLFTFDMVKGSNREKAAGDGAKTE